MHKYKITEKEIENEGYGKTQNVHHNFLKWAQFFD